MSPRILLADDDALFCKMVQYSVEQAGEDWIVETVSSGADTIAAMNQSSPDLLILDLRMPNGDGFSVLSERMEKKQEFPVVVVTHMSGDVEARCKELGAAAIHHKSSLRMDRFVQTVREMLQA